MLTVIEKQYMESVININRMMRRIFGKGTQKTEMNMEAESWRKMPMAEAKAYLEWWMEEGDCNVTVKRCGERGYVMIKLERPNGEKSIQPKRGA